MVKSMKYRFHNTPNRQQGTMAILVSLIILTLITFVSLFTAKTVTMEQKIATNDTNSKIAFEAAEAGLEAALTYVKSGYDQDGDDAVDDELVFESDGKVSIDGAGSQNYKEFTDSSNNTMSKVTVTLTMDASTVSLSENFYITAVGETIDGAATRTISQTVSTPNPLATAPNTPFTARGSMDVGGSATVHNPEGFGTIVTGGTAAITGTGSISTRVANKDTTATSSGNGNNWPACFGGQFECTGSYVGCPGTGKVKCLLIDSAGKSATGGDVIDGETTLAGFTADEFFEATFGVSKANFKANVATMVMTAAEFGNTYATGGASLAVNEIIWVEGDVSTNGVDVGCKVSAGTRNTGAHGAYDMPCSLANIGASIVVVNGDWDVNGGSIYGLLYVIGDVDTHGSPEVIGAMIVEGGATAMTGSMDIWYDSGILNDLANLGAKVSTSGTWKDF